MSVDIPTVEAKLVALSCGHTAWVAPRHELGLLVVCSACPDPPDPEGYATAPVTKWSVAQVLPAQKVAAITDVR